MYFQKAFLGSVKQDFIVIVIVIIIVDNDVPQPSDCFSMYLQKNYLFCQCTVDPKGKGKFSLTEVPLSSQLFRGIKNEFQLTIVFYHIKKKKKSSLAFEPLYNFCVDQGPNFLNHQVPYPSHLDCHLKVWIIISLREI